MDDLRKDYNVSKDRGDIPSIIPYKKIYRTLFYIITTFFVIFYPSIIGECLGKWVNSLYTSFTEYNTILVEDWYTFLITVFTVTIIYTILKWIKTKK